MAIESIDPDAVRSHYARIAQLTTIFLPAVVARLVYLWHYVQSRGHDSSGFSASEDGSYSERQSNSKAALPRRLRVLGNRLLWWIQDEAVAGWGTRAEWTIFVATLSWMFFLSVHNTAFEYIEITRRVGLIAASLMPINMLLIMKSQSLVCLLGGFSEEQMNPYHRIVGRVMIILTTIHGSMFLAYFVQNKMISTRLFDIDILFGLTSVAIFFAIGFTSLAWFRQRHYRTYFITHISLAFIIFPTLYFHTPHLRSYIVESTLIYILNRGLRMATTRVLWAEVVPQTNPNLMSISFLASKGGVFPVYPTTSFIYFTPGGSSIIQSLLKSVVSNPFTVTMNSPKGEPRIVVHRRNGNTAAFDTMSKTTKVLVEGPYGYATSYSPSLADHLLDRCDQFFLCAGGVGATFTMPIANALLHSMNGELEGSIRKRFHVIWVVQSLADVYWAFEGFETSGSSRYQLKDFVRVFVTRDIRPEDDEVIFSDSDDEADEAMELQNKEKRVQRTAAVDGLNISKGRPVVGALVDEFFKAISPSETASIITCGPDNLNRSLRKEVGKFVTKGQSVLWHEEKFGR